MLRNPQKSETPKKSYSSDNELQKEAKSQLEKTVDSRKKKKTLF